jgi:flagellar biosynthesis protein FlhG
MPDQMTRLRSLMEHRIGDDAARPANAPYRLVITSGKGGVGKSTVALNCAWLLAGQDVPVVLVDGETNMANLDILSGCSPEYRLGDVLRGVRDPEECFVTLRPGLRFLAGDSGDCELPFTGAGRQEQVLRAIDNLEEPAGIVIVDTASGMSSDVLGYALGADEIVVVTSTEPTGIIDTYAVLKILRHHRFGGRLGVVVNGARRPSDADEAMAKLRCAVDHFLGLPFHYAATLPYDPLVPGCVMEQEILARKHPMSPAALSLRTMAQNICQSVGMKQVKGVA